MPTPRGYEQFRIATQDLHATVAVAGPADGLPVLFVHGFGNTPRFANRATMAALARTQFASGVPVRIIAPVLPGFSATTPLGGKPTFERYADWCAAVLNALHVTQPVVVVGESMGGAIALTLCANHPNRVAGLALFNSVGVPLPDRRTLSWELGVAVSAMPRRQHFGQWINSVVDAGLVLRHPVNAWQSFRMIAAADRLDVMASIRDRGLPVVAAYGRRDTVVPPTVARSVEEALGIEVAVLDADHRSFIEGHPAISTLVGELIESVVERREVRRDACRLWPSSRRSLPSPSPR